MKRLLYICAFLMMLLGGFEVSSQCLTVEVTGTDVNCFGGNDGQITANVTSGVAPFTYELFFFQPGFGSTKLGEVNTAATQVVFTTGNGSLTEPGAEGQGIVANDLIPGSSYSVRVSASGGGGLFCEVKSASTTISQPEQIMLNADVTNASCNGDSDGAIDLTVSGGIAPYDFQWSNGATTEDISGLSAGTYDVMVTDANGCVEVLNGLVITEPVSLTLSESITHVAGCFGDLTGAIALTIAGGTMPFTILWSNGATTEDLTGVGAGTYSVTVTDINGCTANLTNLVINEPPQLMLNAVVTDVADCFGDLTGAIDLTIAGGTMPFTILWSNGATTEDLTGVGAGTYSVTVTDANGCEETLTGLTINEPPQLTVTIGTVTNVSCNGDNDGTIDINVSGGTTPYDFLWSNGATTEDITGLTTGNYSVTVTDDHGCVATLIDIEVTEPAILSVTLTSTSDISCNGGADGEIDISVAGGTAPYTFAWSSGAVTEDVTGLSAGTFDVTVTDANLCVATLNGITLNEPAQLTAAVNTVTDVTCNGDLDGAIDIDVAGGTLPYTFAWSNGATTEDLAGIGAGTYDVTVTDGNNCSVDITGITVAEPPALSVTLGSVTNVSCNGDNDGTIDINVSGGTTPYDFLWSNGATTEDITGLTAGNYSVTVTDDHGCVATLIDIEVTEPAILTVTLTSTSDISCNGGADGEIDISVAGGTAPYTFAWSSGAVTEDVTGLSAGTFDVTVTDANLCVATLNGITLNEPAQLTAAVNTVTDVTCNGDLVGAIDIDVAGGTLPYTFAWSNGATTEDLAGIGAGTYDVTVTDGNNCSVDITGITVAEPPVLSVTLGSVTDVLCNGDTNGAIDINVSGGTLPYTFTWSNGDATEDITGLAAGIYNLLVSDGNGCAASLNNIEIAEPAMLTASLTSVTNTSCNGETDGAIDITVAGGTAPYDFVWSNTATSEDLAGIGAGTYDVVVSDANGCVAVINGITVTEPAVLNVALGSITDVSCFENADGEIDITVTGGTAPYDFLWTDASTTEDLTGLVAGTYGVTVTDVNGCVATLTGLVVDEPLQITVTETITNISCNGLTDGSVDITVSGGTPGYTFTWSNGALTEDISGLTAGTYTVTITDANGCSIGPLSYSVNEPAPVSASISGTTVICEGEATVLTLTFTGPGPWNATYTDGTTNFNVVNVTSPHTVVVAPTVNTTYTLVSVTDVGCGAGTVSGTATVTVNPVTGDPSVFGSETWIGYVYNDNGDPDPLPGRIDFAPAKYKGFIDENDIGAMNVNSFYDAALDMFDLNLGEDPVTGPNLCGSYAENFSIRFRMERTFTEGAYVFKVGSDDGVQLFVDGLLVIDEFTEHSYEEFESLPVCLSGTHELVITYFEVATDARISFSYGLAEPPVPVDANVVVCINTTTPQLEVSSGYANTVDFHWYTDDALTNLVGSGATYTPGAEFDVTTLDSTGYYVVTEFITGCLSEPAIISVEVTDAAELIPVNSTICVFGGPVDLEDFVQAEPQAGVFTFTGPNLTGSIFDPAGQLGVNMFTVNYEIGTCVATTTLQITVVDEATITVPALPVQVCETGSPVDLLNLVSAIPLGGTFSFSGTGVTGTMFDPAGLPGLQNVTVDYLSNGCSGSETIVFNVTTTATLVVSNFSVCQDYGIVDLRQAADAFPSGGTFSFSGTNVAGYTFDPAGLSGDIMIDVSYDQSGCTANAQMKITILDPSNAICAGIVTCDVFRIQELAIQPDCADPTNGVIDLLVTGGTKNYVVTLDDGSGLMQSISGPGSLFRFSNLTPANYTYRIEDANGEICTRSYNLTTSITLAAAADPTSFEDAICFDQPVGSAIINASGSTTGEYYYSVDGLNWTLFVPGTRVGGLPSNGTYDILVGESPADACGIPVSVTINNLATSALVAVVAEIEQSMSENPTGTMRVIGFSGGLGPYEISLFLDSASVTGQSYNAPFELVTTNSGGILEKKYQMLPGGRYILQVRDDLGCILLLNPLVPLDYEVFFPNVFTPNGDNYNETFFIRNLPPQSKIVITNRWGKEVFASNNYQNDWDGSGQADGMYFYTFSGGGESRTGWVEIIRGKSP